MIKLRLIIFICLTSLLLVSCNKKETKALKDMLNEPFTAPTPSGVLTKADKDHYKEIELAYNERYLNDLKVILENGFEKQLDRFSDNELGFFSTYGQMFDYIFKSRKSREEKWRVKSSKYFNALDIKEEAQKCYEDYLKDVTSIRSNFYKSTHKNSLPSAAVLNIPEQYIYIDALNDYARNEWIIEIGGGILAWFIVLVIIAVISFFVGFPTKGISWFVTIVSIIIQVFLSIRNTDKILNKLREQNIATMSIDYSETLKKLNNNTYNFYGK